MENSEYETLKRLYTQRLESKVDDLIGLILKEVSECQGSSVFRRLMCLDRIKWNLSSRFLEIDEIEKDIDNLQERYFQENLAKAEIKEGEEHGSKIEEN